MSAILRVLLIVSSLGTLIYILGRIHKARLRIQDSIFWIVFSFITLILAVFPHIVYGLTELVGVDSPVNLVFLIFIFIAYIKLFSTTARISALENKINRLAYEEAMKKRWQEQAERREEGR